MQGLGQAGSGWMFNEKFCQRQEEVEDVKTYCSQQDVLLAGLFHGLFDPLPGEPG